MIAFIEYFILATLFSLFIRFNLNHIIYFGIKKKYNMGWMFLWLVYTLIASLRSVGENYGGADAYTYVNGFINGEFFSNERLFYFIGELIRIATDNYHVYFFVIYGVIVTAVLWFAYNFFSDKTDFLLWILLFSVYITSFGVIRQWMAIAVGMVSIILLSKEKYKYSIVVSFLGGLIHYTMLVYFVIILVFFLIKKMNIKVTGIKLIIMGIIINILFLLTKDIFISILSATEYSAYVSKEVLSNVSWKGYLPSIVLIFVFLLVYVNKKNIILFEELILWFMFCHLSTIYVMVSLGMFRLLLCFFPIRIISIKLLKERIKTKFERNHTNVYLLMIDLMTLLFIFLDMWRAIKNGALPYYL